MKPFNSIIYPKWTQSITMALFLFVIGSSSFAQSSYGKVTNTSAKSTITRVWLEDPLTWVDYTFDGTDGVFYLRTGVSPSVVSATLPEREVTDFEILHDTVFFCGNNNNGGAFVGSFDIVNLFAGSDFFSITNLIFLDRSSKIAVYEGTFCTRMAVIGHSTMGYGISDIQWHPSNKMEYNYSELSETEVFEDVDVTDHYVVAVENKGTPHGSHYMRVFDKYHSPTFLSSPIGQDIYGAYNDSYSKNLVTHISGDYFAVVALAIRPNNLYGNNILLYNGTTFLGSIFTPLWNYYDSHWCMRDFRYSPDDNMLYLLEDMTRIPQGGIEPMIFQYDYSNPSLSVNAFFTPNDVFLQSIDCTNTSVLLGSGSHNQTGELYSLQWMLQQSFDCIIGEEHFNTNPNPGPTVFQHVFSPLNRSLNEDFIYPNISTHTYLKICPSKRITP